MFEIRMFSLPQIFIRQKLEDISGKVFKILCLYYLLTNVVSSFKINYFRVVLNFVFTILYYSVLNTIISIFSVLSMYNQYVLHVLINIINVYYPFIIRIHLTKKKTS